MSGWVARVFGAARSEGWPRHLRKRQPPNTRTRDTHVGTHQPALHAAACPKWSTNAHTHTNCDLHTHSRVFLLLCALSHCWSCDSFFLPSSTHCVGALSVCTPSHPHTLIPSTPAPSRPLHLHTHTPYTCTRTHTHTHTLTHTHTHTHTQHTHPTPARVHTHTHTHKHTHPTPARVHTHTHTHKHTHPTPARSGGDPVLWSEVLEYFVGQHDAAPPASDCSAQIMQVRGVCVRCEGCVCVCVCMRVRACVCGGVCVTYNTPSRSLPGRHRSYLRVPHALARARAITHAINHLRTRTHTHTYIYTHTQVVEHVERSGVLPPLVVLQVRLCVCAACACVHVTWQALWL